MTKYTPEQEKAGRELLTKGDKLGLEAAVVTGQKYTPVSSFSSEKGVDLVNKAVDSYNKMTAPPPTLAKPNEKTTTEKTTSTFINPETDQSATISSTDKSSGRNLVGKGYQFAEGDYPSYLDDDEESRKLENAASELSVYQDKLKNFAQTMSNDPVLQQNLSGISSRWDSRIKEMEKMNLNRKEALRTTGIRLGSRWTGGDGGVFGSIVSEEERQGVDRIKELEAAKQAELAAARGAYESEQWDRYVQLMNQAEKNYEKQLGVVAELNQAQAKQDNILREKAIQVSRDTAIADLFTQGITDPAEMLNLLNFDDSGQMVGDFTLEDIKKSMDVLSKGMGTSVEGLSGDAKNFFTLKNIKGALPKSITSLPEEEQFFAYIKQTNDAARKGSATRVGLGGGTGNDFENFTNEQIALGAVPVQLRNTEAELNRFLSGIRIGLDQGYTPYEIADKLMGYNVSNPDRFSTSLRSLFSSAEIDSSTIANVARLLNSGNKVQALNEVETRIMARAKKDNPDFYVSESNVDYFVSNAKKLQLMVEALEAKGGSPVGEFSGSFQKWLGRFKSGEAQKIATQATQLYAEMRNRISGSAVTESEGKYLEPLIPRLEDDPNNFLTKVRQLQTDSLSRLNRIRSQYNLPQLDSASLRNKTSRIPLYENTVPQDAFDNPLDIQSSVNDDPLGILN